MWRRSFSYVKKAGTFILAASIIIWALLTFPKADHVKTSFEQQVQTIELTSAEQLATPDLPDQRRQQIERERDERIDSLRAECRMREAEFSIAGRLGKMVEPLVRPAGFDWKISVALFSGIAAKEVIISTMGIVYGIGEADPDAEGNDSDASPLKDRLRADKAMSPAVALSLMVFVMVYVPCIATLAVTRKELGSFKWPAFMAGFTLVVAWILAVAVFQTARLLSS
jgi:ferrous iron transport protein B